MASDIVQRAAAICGYPFTPSSDQLAAWLDSKRVAASFDSAHASGSPKWWTNVEPVDRPASAIKGRFPTLLESVAAAVVEVDRIEREAKKP